MFSACEIVLNLSTKNSSTSNMAPTTLQNPLNSCSLPVVPNKGPANNTGSQNPVFPDDKPFNHARSNSSSHWPPNKVSRAIMKGANPGGPCKQGKKLRDSSQFHRESNTSISSSNDMKLCPLRTAFIPSRDELKKMSVDSKTDENIFRTSQLVPRSFLSDPLWSHLVPNNFFISALHSSPPIPSMLVFTLQPQPGKILFRPVHFVVAVAGPNNSSVPIRMRIHKNEQGKELMYVYFFRPEEPGVYTAKVRLAANGIPHVCQSPLTFYVSEDGVSDASSCSVETEKNFSNLFLPRRTSSLSSISSNSSNSMEIQ